jgi:hypothetical protein
MNFQRPHYRWNGEKGTYVIMSTEITTPDSANVPDWMRKASTGASIGNIDSSDLKPPQLKMLAGMSPEVINGTPGASPGNFWMTIFNQNLGHSVTGTFILLRKSYQVWAPKGVGVSNEQKGPLASATNGISWDVPNQTFDIRFPQNPKIYKWKIGKLVTDFGAKDWGSQQPEDPKSKPIATLTYNTLWCIDMPNGAKQLCVFISSRTAVKPMQNFFAALKAHGVDHYFQRYRIVQQKLTGPTGDPFFTYEFQYIGNIQDEAEAMQMKALHVQYSKSGFVSDVEAEAEDIRTERRTEGTHRDVPEAADSDDIPF